MRQAWVKLSLLALCLVVSLATAQAQSDEAFLVYRQKLMQGQGASMGAISQIVKNKLPFSGHIATHAHDINRLSKLIADAFEKKITEGKTDAKPEVWQDWDKFVEAAKKLESESAKLAQIATGGDMAAIGAQVKAVGKSCGGCHKPFRKPKEERFKR